MAKEALTTDFKTYAAAIVANAKALSEGLVKRGLKIVSGGTDSHLLLVDLRPIGVSGKIGEAVLDKVGITVNKNTVPFDPQPPSICSGVRLGTPAVTTRGMGVAEMSLVADFIFEALTNVENESKLKSVADNVRELSKKFPLYRHRLVR
jgi:glycine hydroxymethyltransferase